MTQPDKTPVAAIVVGFFPNFLILDALLRTLLDQAGCVIFVDNAGGGHYLAAHPDERKQVHYIKLHGNQGLGKALNAGFEEAVSRGFDFVATFDQDSAPPPSMLAGLLAAHRDLAVRGVKCAAVGPRFYDSREGSVNKFPVYKQVGYTISAVPHIDNATGLFDVDMLITSGMLVNTRVWKQGITYNSDLFIDYTDTDWCFRARAAGLKLFVCPSQEMAHALSDAPPVRLLGLNFLRYSPLRRYYYFRNTVFFVSQSYVSWPWKTRLLAGLVVRFVSNLFIDSQKLAGLKMSLLGIAHGARRKLGPYR